MKLPDEFIEQTIRQASAELDNEEKVRKTEGRETMVAENESILAGEALEIDGAIRGGEGDLNEDIKEPEPRKKRKYTKRAVKADGHKTHVKKEQHDDHDRIPEAVKEALERELVHIAEEQLRLEEREKQIVDFLEGRR